MSLQEGNEDPDYSFVVWALETLALHGNSHATPTSFVDAISNLPRDLSGLDSNNPMAPYIVAALDFIVSPECVTKMGQSYPLYYVGSKFHLLAPLKQALSR